MTLPSPRPTRAAAALALALAGPAAAVLAPSTASAQDLGVNGILSTLGITAPDRDPIDYRERAPLVVPKEMRLREPEAAGDARATAAWPNDPDIARRRAAAADARRPVNAATARRGAENGALTPSELQAVRGSNAPTAPVVRHGDHARDEWFADPGVLRRAGQSVASQTPTMGYGKEPERRLLSEPPAGYRTPAASAPLGDGRGEPVSRSEKDNDERSFITEERRR